MCWCARLARAICVCRGKISMSTTSRFAKCFCPVCPARKGGTCGVVLDASFCYGVVCPCTSGCNRQFSECCYVDSDGEVTNCCDDCGGGSHRVCACCGDRKSVV